jgi:hypothetical protein
MESFDTFKSRIDVEIEVLSAYMIMEQHWPELDQNRYLRLSEYLRYLRHVKSFNENATKEDLHYLKKVETNLVIIRDYVMK